MKFPKIPLNATLHYFSPNLSRIFRLKVNQFNVGDQDQREVCGTLMDRWIENSVKELKAGIRMVEKVVESDDNSVTSDETRMVEETLCGSESTDKDQEKDDHPEQQAGQDDSDEERYTVVAIFPKGHPLHRSAEPKDDEEE